MTFITANFCPSGTRYTYYFVSLHTKNIWWKSALTMGQMVQFTFMLTQAILIFARSCGEKSIPPPRVVHMYFYYIFSLLGLFAQFFVKSYVTKPPRGADAAVSGKKKSN